MSTITEEQARSVWVGLCIAATLLAVALLLGAGLFLVLNWEFNWITWEDFLGDVEL